MSHPHDYSGRSRRSITSAPDEADLQHESCSPQPYDQQNYMQAESYGTPQISQLPHLSRLGSHQTSTQFSSQRPSPLFSPSDSYLSNNTTDTTLSSAATGCDAPGDYGYAQQSPQSPYVRGTTCSIDSYESHQDAMGRERRPSTRSNAPLPPTGRRSDHRGDHHGSIGYPSGSRSRRHRGSSVVQDDEEVPLEGHRNPPIPSDLPPTYQYAHGRPGSNADFLVGVGGHIDDRLYDPDTRVVQGDPSPVTIMSETNDPNAATTVMWMPLAHLTTGKNQPQADTKVTDLEAWYAKSLEETHAIRPWRPVHRCRHTQPYGARACRSLRRKQAFIMRSRDIRCLLPPWTSRLAPPTLPVIPSYRNKGLLLEPGPTRLPTMVMDISTLPGQMNRTMIRRVGHLEMGEPTIRTSEILDAEKRPCNAAGRAY
ncbi:hypothetical protein VMCG_01847 [Cytospora schulzeri]|uniref:Uncharacterized protein n=1 Tax=Cytospora schulzeri TaxID=448051 RepID=A0A423X3N7_9PEZI|nr:hypothetical protein VMCG_01847 [Valsa malicola]